MRFEEHCRRCNDVLEAPFPQVHLWIDELARVQTPAGVRFDTEHRKHRHNMAGIEQVRKMWGDRAASAASLHVLDDIYGPVPHSVNHVIPRDEADFVRMGCY